MIKLKAFKIKSKHFGSNFLIGKVAGKHEAVSAILNDVMVLI